MNSPDRAPKPRPAVTVAICTRNRPELLRQAVASVLSGTVVPEELLVVDQSAEALGDLSAACAGVTGPRYLHRPGRGLSIARNIATAAAANPVLIFVDDDVEVGRDWLTALLEPLATGDHRRVATGPVLPHPDRPPGTFVPTLKPYREAASYSGRISFDPLVTFNMAVHKDFLAEIGGFDERLGPGTEFPAGEDNELAYRILNDGGTIEIAPEALVFHRAWRSDPQYVPLRKGYGVGQGAFLAKHFNPFTARRFLGAFLANIARAPRRLIEPIEPGRELSRLTLAKGDVAFSAGMFLGAAGWWLRNGRLPQRRPDPPSNG